MTTTSTHDTGTPLPHFPPLPIGGLVAGALNLLQEAAALPQPGHISIDDTQSITVQFDGEPASLKAITRWALHFGGLVVSEPHQTESGPQTWCRTGFHYCGIAVRAFAHIPDHDRS
jgi:hypothetical protein